MHYFTLKIIHLITAFIFLWPCTYLYFTYYEIVYKIKTNLKLLILWRIATYIFKVGMAINALFEITPKLKKMLFLTTRMNRVMNHTHIEFTNRNRPPWARLSSRCVGSDALCFKDIDCGRCRCSKNCFNEFVSCKVRYYIFWNFIFVLWFRYRPSYFLD